MPLNEFISNPDTELFRLIVSLIGDEIMILDSNGQIVYLNDAAAQGLGYPKSKLLNRPVLDFLKEKISTSQWKKNRFAELKKHKRSITYIFDRIGKGRKIQTINATAVYMAYQNREYVILVARDVTKELVLQNKLKEAEKMKALELFIVGILQEIQYPLKAVGEHVNALIEKYKSRNFEYLSFKEFNELINGLDIIRNQIHQSSETVSQLTTTHRRKIGLNDRGANLNKVITEVVQFFRLPLVQSLVTLKLNLSRNIPLVRIAPVELNQVIGNILNNAIQSFLIKGTLSIRTRLSKDKQFVQFECQDQGIGIPKEHLSRIFEPFFTTKQKGKEKGRGLGLSIVYSIIKKISGDIVISSSLRQGTNVKIDFPVYKA